jgi:histidine phosphotransfer protein HptB
MSSPVVIDLEAIENLRALNPGDQDEFLREITGIFLADTPRRIVELEQCLAAGDAAGFSRAAHSIKGSSANLGAVALRAAAEQLERRAHQQGLGEIAPLLASLQVEFARAESELIRLITP